MTKRNRDILKKAKQALKDAKFDFPLLVLLGMIKQEAPRQNGQLSNTGDGLMQVTLDSGNRGGQYGNTNRGIMNNLIDGIKTLQGFARGSTSLAMTVSRYNGGNAEKMGDQKYTQNVAARINSGEVGRNFGKEFSPEKLSEEDKKIVKALDDYKRPK